MMEKRTLREISTFIRTGKTPPTSQTKYFEGEVNWYTPGDLDLGKYLTKSRRTLTQLAFDDKKAVIFPKDTLLIGCIGDIGKIGITTDLCSSNQQLTGLYPNEKADVSYLYYWFRGNKKTLESTSNNAVVPILNNRTLETIKIPLPPLPQQQKIANILDAADALRQKDKALLAKYDELTQALFLDMFGDPVSNPKGWDKVKLEEISKISSGSTPSRENESYYDGEIPWVKTGEVNGKVIYNTSEHISEEALKNSSCKLYPIGSLIIAMYGQGKTRGQIGMLGIEATTNQACGVLSPSNKMNFNFLFHLLQLHYEDLRSLGRGGNQPNLNSGLLKNYIIFNPPIKLQNQFAERVQVIEQQKAIAQKSLEKSEALFNSLLQKAFKGEVV